MSALFLTAEMPTGRGAHVRQGRLSGLAWIVWALAAVGYHEAIGLAQASPTARAVDPETGRAIHATPLHPGSGDDQTSWIIEPEVPRIPRIAGFEAALPPHIERRLSYAFDLAQRGATYSANNEFRTVLSLCAAELDARNGGTRRREALRQGWLALDEADELAGDQIDWLNPADIQQAVVGHSTPVLKRDPPRGDWPTDSIQAVQSYYAFAEERLIAGCEGLPGASMAFYGMARTFAAPAARMPHADGKSALLHRVALAVAPQNVLAANELGVLLAQHGHLNDAEQIFRQCVAIHPTPEAWHNLAVVLGRKGDHESSRAALVASHALADRQAASGRVAGGSEASKVGDSVPTAHVDHARDADEGERKPGFLARFGSEKLRLPFFR